MKKSAIEKGFDPLKMMAELNQMNATANKITTKNSTRPGTAQVKTNSQYNPYLQDDFVKGKKQNQAQGQSLKNVVKKKSQFPNALFGEPERLKKSDSQNPFENSTPGRKNPMIQENYMDNNNTRSIMNQALLKSKNLD